MIPGQGKNKENMGLKRGPSSKYYLNPPVNTFGMRAENPLEGMPLNFQMNFLGIEIRKRDKEVSEFVEIEPKVMESFDPIPGRVHRKVDIERKKRKVIGGKINTQFFNLFIRVVFQKYINLVLRH